MLSTVVMREGQQHTAGHVEVVVKKLRKLYRLKCFRPQCSQPMYVDAKVYKQPVQP